MMRTFRCPKCYKVQKAMASSVAHRCPSNKSVMTAWILVDKTEKEK